jgi:hypothetical protein
VAENGRGIPREKFRLFPRAARGFLEQQRQQPAVVEPQQQQPIQREQQHRVPCRQALEGMQSLPFGVIMAAEFPLPCGAGFRDQQDVASAAGNGHRSNRNNAGGGW